MAEHTHFQKEKGAIDALIADGYKIASISDHLNGSTVLFTKAGTTKTFLAANANARKYASTLFCKGQAWQTVTSQGGNAHEHQ
ncbi:hypothetical protein [Shouchella clausii]|uniref:hypothetical protein n=1 Tax=Shouchella clausii TaxID=79880 RepID=UPI000BA74D1E|nr:hypothetical protein [Shouchella clausii]MCR1287036.1 hypothetical protein [Shouchella clausii]PAD17537.1 hypothetical protein CHH73_09340 [Shouchella clausii]